MATTTVFLRARSRRATYAEMSGPSIEASWAAGPKGAPVASHQLSGSLLGIKHGLQRLMISWPLRLLLPPRRTSPSRPARRQSSGRRQRHDIPTVIFDDFSRFVAAINT